MRMTDRFPSSVALQQKYGRPRPTNRDFNTTAQRAVDTLATAAAEKTSNAVKVDGWPAYVHMYRFGSKVCTCKANPYVETPAGTAPDTSTIVRDGGTGIAGTTAPRPRTTFVLRGEFPETSLNDARRSDLQTFGPDNSEDVAFDGNVDEFRPEDIDVNNVLSTYSTLDDKPCGICGASGFIDTYQWMSGHKILLLPDDASIANGEINTNTRPHSIDLYKGGYAEWASEIPAYFTEVDVWRVRDNMAVPKEVKLKVDLTGTGNGPWSALSPNVFDGLKGTGGKVVFRAEAVNINDDEVAMFSHAEVYIRTRELPYCQFPQIDRDITSASIESIINTSFEIDPKLGPISRKSLIEVPAMGRMWTVTSLSTKQTAKGFVFNISGQVLVTQPNMPTYALALSPRWQGNLLAGYTAVNPNTGGVKFPHQDNPLADLDGTAASSRNG